tara:strand:- start:461 stop:1597 length:1137 start_codon:yes stop_codon:yes gene_type:complete
MKKILVINTKYREFGGEDSNIEEEVKFLSNFYNVQYLEYDNSEKINIYDFLSFFFQFNYKSNKILKKKLDSFSPDIVYIHNTWFKAGLGIFKTLKKKNLNVIVKVHNFRHECSSYLSAKKHKQEQKFCFKCGFSGSVINKYYPDSYTKSFLLTLYSKKYLKILKSNDIQILVLNKFSKQRMEKLRNSGENISIFYNPLDIKNLQRGKYNPNSSYVVYAGRLSEPKGLTELLNTWKEVNLKNIKLKIIGTGDIKDQLEQKFKGKNIEFLGSMSNSEAVNEIRNSRAVITATKMYEGQPRLLNEASAMGVPSIFPDFGGMTEYFPQNYKLSFIQYNYKDLKQKLFLLKDEKLLDKYSNEVKEYFSDLQDKNYNSSCFEDM